MHRGKYVSVCCEYRRVQDCCHLHYNTSATCMNYREKHPLELCTAVALGSSGGGVRLAGAPLKPRLGQPPLVPIWSRSCSKYQGSADCWGRVQSFPSTLGERSVPVISQSVLFPPGRTGQAGGQEGQAEYTTMVVGPCRLFHRDPYCPPYTLQEEPDPELTTCMTWNKSLDLSELL